MAQIRAAWAYRLALVVATVLLSLGSAVALARLAGLPAQTLALPGAAYAFVLSRRAGGRPAGEEPAHAVVFSAVAGAAAGLAGLMTRQPVLGAAAFVALLTAAAWARRFGAKAGGVGVTVVLALIAALMSPTHVRAWWPDCGRLALVALMAFCWVPAVRWAGHRLTGLPGPEGRRPAPLPPTRPGSRAPGTRRALQTAVSLTAAFTVGLLLFPGHWSWTVLSAVIVGLATGGRGNLLLRAVERGAGAVAGTMAATVLAMVVDPHGTPGIVLILVVLTTTAGLREVSRTLFAAAVTTLMSLLHGYLGRPDAHLLPARLGALTLGAVLAAAVGWFVVPVRSGDVLRSRLAVAVGALAAVLGARRRGEGVEAALTRFEQAAAAVEDVARPYRLHRRLFGTSPADGPHRADLVDALRECREPVRALAVTPLSEESLSDLGVALERLVRALPALGLVHLVEADVGGGAHSEPAPATSPVR
ncbi:FUSC family protein [Kitasatospora sp. NPDC093558]|uniref:FUSC family protein n=1 Tax=Kitasatospora sp. NPDC093558 TaxID=3155201 RepID=UPI0034455E82